MIFGIIPIIFFLSIPVGIYFIVDFDIQNSVLPGPTELMLIFGAFLLLFGPNKLPEIANAVGEMTKKFREGASGTKSAVTEKIQAAPKMTDEDMIVNYANELGISTTGKSISEIAQEILKLQS